LRRRETDPVLLGGDEGIGVVLVAKAEKLLEVSVSVSVVIAERGGRRDVDAETTECGEEFVRARDRTEDDGSACRGNRETALLYPNGRSEITAPQLFFEVAV